MLFQHCSIVSKEFSAEYFIISLQFFYLGARTIVVIGVSELSSEAKAKFIELDYKYGAKIEHLRMNISSAEGMTSLSSKLDDLPEVAGIINSAGIVDDKEVTNIDKDSYQRVMNPKVNGNRYSI